MVEGLAQYLDVLCQKYLYVLPQIVLTLLLTFWRLFVYSAMFILRLFTFHPRTPSDGEKSSTGARKKSLTIKTGNPNICQFSRPWPHLQLSDSTQMTVASTIIHKKQEQKRFLEQFSVIDPMSERTTNTTNCSLSVFSDNTNLCRSMRVFPDLWKHKLEISVGQCIVWHLIHLSVESEVVMCWDRVPVLGQHHNQCSECVFRICLERKNWQIQI